MTRNSDKKAMENVAGNSSLRNKKEIDNTSPSEFEKFKQEIKDIIQNHLLSRDSELKKINSTLQQIKETNSSIENSISFLAEQNEELKKKVEQLEVDHRKDKEYITLLEEKLEDTQRESRKRNIEIKNVPMDDKETKEDLLQMVTKLSETIECKITQSEVMDIYRRRGKKQEENGPIIVEMSSTMLKANFLKKCEEHNTKNRGNKLSAKHVGKTKNENTPVYISEQLTPKAARLRFLASDLTKSKGYSFCWTYLGRVFVRKSENSPVIQINSETQVQRLMQEA